MDIQNSIQCPYCRHWFASICGGFKKHIRKCRPTEEDITCTSVFPSTNPLLSRMHLLEGPIKNIDYELDSVHDAEVDEDINFGSNNNISFNEEQPELKDVKCNKSPLSYSSVIKFQVGLSHIVNKHKASLQMYDDVCSLVNEYTSSHDFYQYAKLQSRKNFLKSIEERHGTHTMKPNHCNVMLHDNTYVTVPVFDTKTMIISLPMV